MNNKFKIISVITCLSVILIQPINQKVEALVHLDHTSFMRVEISLFSEVESEAVEIIDKAEAEPEFREQNKGQVIAAQALTWKGVDFKRGVTARCADFVRHVLALEGITLPVPSDSLGPLMADSFFVPEAGTIIKDYNYLRPGDIVMFSETYDGGGRILPGAKGNRRITHVGIVVSDCSTGECMMIDRSTRSRPVNYRSIHTEFTRGYGSHFHSALRPHAYN